MPPENVNAAVNVILRCNRGVVEVLLIRRVTNPKDPWSGDIAFPGGRMEEEDKDFLETALRETFEEVGIPKDKLEVIGVLDLAYTLAGVKYNVAPVVSRLKDEVPLNLGNEVEKAFWMPLSPMEEKKVIHPLRGVMVRAYIYEGEIIWGMTKRLSLIHI